jgi:exodeoxyribonuclease VII small subunit
VAKDRPAGRARADTAADGGASDGAPGEAPDGAPGEAAETGAAGSEPSGGGGSARKQGTRPPYEKARDELASLVKRLEAGGLTLEQSLELWERGEQLADICEEWLEGARARLAAAVGRRDERAGRDGPAGNAASAAETPF